MSQKTIIAILASILIIAGGAAAYLLFSDDKETSTSNTQNQTATEATIDTPSTISGSIASMLGANTARKCTYSDEVAQGTVYVTNDNRMRVDFVNVGSEEENGSMIVTHNRQHIWNDSKKEGMTMAYTAAPESDEAPEDSDQSVDMNHEYTLTCSPWKVDEALLTPPTDVNFVDMAALMQGHLQQ